MRNSLTPRRIRREERGFEAAHDRFKRRYTGTVLVGILASVAVHFAVFSGNPAFGVVRLADVEEEMAVVHLPPEVRIPPPPTAIARPATPRISAEPISETVTIAPTTFEENPVENLAPPPPGTVTDVRERPVYIARDVEPRLRNGPEIRRLLEKLYPSRLKEAGIGGQVILWVYVEEDGRPGPCQVHRSSGYTILDEIAEQIVGHMEFSPAMCRDRPVGVWISQPIEFRVRDVS